MSELYIAPSSVVSFVEGEFGGPTEDVDEVVTVTSTASRLVKNDPERLELMIFNQSPTDIYIGLTPEVTSINGILIKGNGGGVIMNIREDMTLQSRAWFAVTVSGTADVYIVTTKRFALG